MITVYFLLQVSCLINDLSIRMQLNRNENSSKVSFCSLVFSDKIENIYSVLWFKDVHNNFLEYVLRFWDFEAWVFSVAYKEWYRRV